MRHAKAVRPDGVADDFQRALEPRGAAEAAAAARLLSDLCPPPDIALVSAARRTKETWAEVAPVFPAREALIEDDLYLASSAIWRARLAPLRDCETILLIGHNPGLKELAYDLMGPGPHDARARERLSDGLPTSCALVFGLSGMAEPGTGRLAAFVSPPRASDADA